MALGGTMIGFMLDDLPRAYQAFDYFCYAHLYFVVAGKCKADSKPVGRLFWGVIGPLLYPVFSDWAIFVAGFVGACLAVLMMTYSQADSNKGGRQMTDIWLVVGAGAFATFMWRFAGIVIAKHINPDSLLMVWVNAAMPWLPV